jgi:hypothetical protein
VFGSHSTLGSSATTGVATVEATTVGDAATGEGANVTLGWVVPQPTIPAVSMPNANPVIVLPVLPRRIDVGFK